MEQFLGRTFDTKTRTWRYADGSGGAMPEEIRQDFLSGAQKPGDGSFLRAFNPVWRWRRLTGNL